MKKQWKWYVYVIECPDNNYFTGMSLNVSKQELQHASGLGEKYAARHRFKKVAYVEGHY
jgi:predicted GIY-YIG superfamily endonuclease